MRIIIFGAGDKGKELLLHIKNDILPDEVIAFWDNDSKKWGTFFEQIEIRDPRDHHTSDFDYVVIASSYESEIRLQLMQYGIENSILSLEEYKRKKNANMAYFYKYNNVNEEKVDVFSDRLIVYTAITGGYDRLNEPLFVSPDIEYVCFTNDRNLKSSRWIIEYINSQSLDNMYLAKKVKMFPQEYLGKNITSVWVDGKFQIVGDMREYIKKYEKTKPILCFPHFARNCIFDEAACCVTYGIGRKEEIIHQISKYEREGYPFNNGLYEMGCIVRNHNDSYVQEIMSHWWNEVSLFSNRDQISFPYVCWKHGFEPDISNEDIYGNKWLQCKRNYCKDK